MLKMQTLKAFDLEPVTTVQTDYHDESILPERANSQKHKWMKDRLEQNGTNSLNS